MEAMTTQMTEAQLQQVKHVAVDDPSLKLFEELRTRCSNLTVLSLCTTFIVHVRVCELEEADSW